LRSHPGKAVILCIPSIAKSVWVNRQYLSPPRKARPSLARRAKMQPNPAQPFRSDENDMRCATGTPATGAQVNAQAKAQVNAQVIFPRTSVTSKTTRKSFCQLRKSFWLEAQVILPAAQVILA